MNDGSLFGLYENLQGWDFNYIVEDSGRLLASLPHDEDAAIFSRIDVRRAAPAGPTRFQSGKDELRYTLHRVDLSDGGVKRLEFGDAETIRWVVGGDGNVEARIDFAENTGRLGFFIADEKRLKLSSSLTLTDEEVEQSRLVGPAPEAGVFIIRYTDNDAGFSYRQVDMATGQFRENAFATTGKQVTEIYNPRNARAHAVVVDSGAEIFHFDPAMRKVQQSMEKSIPGARILVESASADGNTMILRAYYPIKPAEWYLYDRAARRLEIIGRN